jgi:hypothetical protein
VDPLTRAQFALEDYVSTWDQGGTMNHQKLYELMDAIADASIEVRMTNDARVHEDLAACRAELVRVQTRCDMLHQKLLEARAKP